MGGRKAAAHIRPYGTKLRGHSCGGVCMYLPWCLRVRRMDRTNATLCAHALEKNNPDGTEKILGAISLCHQLDWLVAEPLTGSGAHHTEASHSTPAPTPIRAQTPAAPHRTPSSEQNSPTTDEAPHPERASAINQTLKPQTSSKPQGKHK